MSKVQLFKPQRDGYGRDFVWCYKCGAPKWVEWPSHLVRTVENIEQVKICEPTCDCNVGWHSGSPNRVYASNCPAGWHVRKIIGLDL